MTPTEQTTGIQEAIAKASELAARDGALKTRTGQQSTSGPSWLSRRLGVSPQALSVWLRRGWVPVNRADEIEQLVNVPARRLLNPRLVKMLDSKVTR